MVIPDHTLEGSSTSEAESTEANDGIEGSHTQKSAPASLIMSMLFAVTEIILTKMQYPTVERIMCCCASDTPSLPSIPALHPSRVVSPTTLTILHATPSPQVSAA